MRNPPSPPHACRAYLLRSCMTRSTVTLKPQPHASLGLPAYVQFTSPIRRCGCGGGSVGQWGWGVQKCGGCDRVEVCGGRGEEALPLHAKGWCQWLAFSAPHHIDWISNPDTITPPPHYPPLYLPAYVEVWGRLGTLPGAGQEGGGGCWERAASEHNNLFTWALC